MEVIEGLIHDIDPKGEITIKAPYNDWDKLATRKYNKCLIGLTDGRKASVEQVRKAHVIISEIADWVGDLPEYIKRLMKLRFIASQQSELYNELFSFSSCDMTIAREFITYLIDFMIEHHIPSNTPLRLLCEDIRKYTYACLAHKRCAVCGLKGELHHIDAIGMGQDRTETVHEGMEAISLCREHHVECHSMGQTDFNLKYHLEGGVLLDQKLCKKYKLKRSKISR